MSTITDGETVLYRISAGCCSIIVTRAISRCLNDNNKQLARVFLCPFIMIRGGCGPFVKLVVEDLNSILLTINFYDYEQKVFYFDG